LTESPLFTTLLGTRVDVERNMKRAQGILLKKLWWSPV
jgi:hypothetical protein